MNLYLKFDAQEARSSKLRYSMVHENAGKFDVWGFTNKNTTRNKISSKYDIIMTDLFLTLFTFFYNFMFT